MKKTTTCIKCEEGTLGKPKYCRVVGYNSCIHSEYSEHLFRTCNVCGFIGIEQCKDKIPKEVYEEFGGK